MRDMHKWKDKAEFSLDNRQIFFLFFGLSVVGCFIFALGIMTGRRLDGLPNAQMATIPSNSLELLDAVESSEPSFAFKEGIKETSATATPPTRDPAVPPRAEKLVKAEKEGAQPAQAVAPVVAAKDPTPASAKGGSAAMPPVREPPPAATTTTPAASAPVAADPALASSTALAASEAKPAAAGRVYTLQMKAFSHAEEAASLADKLRRNGHAIRVEQAEVKGRTWHRVRLGHFDDYNAAMAAKAQFEKAEHVIAYVVAQ